MKYLDEYRDPALARRLVAEIRRSVTRPWVLMEICGGQTHTLVKYGIEELVGERIELVHGPGCPVCVTPLEIVDKAIAIASIPEVIFVSYGDMLRVPGSHSDLFQVKAAGGDVRIAYSPMDALRLARENPQRPVVFFAVGFETTAPANSTAVWQAKREGLRNFSMLVSHVLVPPAIRLLLESPANRVQGFIAPGHVCAVMGYWEYEALSRQYRVPIVVGGFEPVDLIEAIGMLVAQLEEGRAEAEWRGIGAIPQSGFRLRPEFAEYDAERIFGLADATVEEPAECIAAEVLQGLKKPVDCPAFGVRCTPESPLGAPMVSAEGACAAGCGLNDRSSLVPT